MSMMEVCGAFLYVTLNKLFNTLAYRLPRLVPPEIRA